MRSLSFVFQSPTTPAVIPAKDSNVRPHGKHFIFNFFVLNFGIILGRLNHIGLGVFCINYFVKMTERFHCINHVHYL